MSGAVAQGTVAFAPMGHGNGSNHANSPAPDLPTEERTTDVEAWRERIESRRAKAGATRALTAAALAAQNAAARAPVEPTPILAEDVDVVETRPVPRPPAPPVKVDAKTARRLAWVTAYLDGDSIATIAQREGVAMSTVHKHLRDTGVQLRPVGVHGPKRSPSAPPVAPSAPAPLSTPVPEEPEPVEPDVVEPAAAAPRPSRRASAVAEYSAGGTSIAELATRYGVARATVRGWLIAAGVPIAPMHRFGPENVKAAQAAQKATRERIAAAGVTPRQIRDWARTRGLPVTDRGHLPAQIVDAYFAAQSAPAAAAPEEPVVELPAAPGPCSAEDGAAELEAVAAAAAYLDEADLAVLAIPPGTPDVADVAAQLMEALAAATQLVEGYRAFVIARLRAARAGVDVLLAAMGETP